MTDGRRRVARRPDAYELTCHLVELVHDVDPDQVGLFWDDLSDGERRSVLVVLACQIDPQRVTTNGLRARVDRVAGVTS